MKIATRHWLVLVLSVWSFTGVLAGCLSPFPVWEGKDPRATNDAGVSTDAGPALDGGAAGEDAGALADGGVAMDDGGVSGADAGAGESDGGSTGVDGGPGGPGWDGGIGTEPNCGANEHAEGGACVPNQRACSVNNGVGQEVWGADAWGSCTVTGCDSDYHVESNACAPDTKSCSVTNGTGTQTWNGSAYGACNVQSCNNGYHVEGATCASDTRSCTITNGTGTQSYAGGAWGACSLESCNSGYHEEGGACVSNTRTCIVTNGTGNETWDGSAWGSCTATGCDSDYHVENNACAPDTKSCTIDNGSGTQTWEGSAYGACSLVSCNSGYHDGGNGTCVTTGTCASGYELNGDGACVSSAGGFLTGPVDMQFAVIPKGTFTMGSPSSELGHLSDETQHAVTFTYDFAMGVTEVTQGQWKAMSGGTNPSYFPSCGDNCPVEQVDWYSTLAYANALSRDAGLQECYTLTPAACADEVSDWGDGDTVTGSAGDCTGATFVGLSCTGYRLPTEAEWEYAYRAGTTTAYYNGVNTQTNRSPLDPNLDAIGWYGGNSGVSYSGGSDCSGWYDGSTTCGTLPVGQKTDNAWGLYDMAGNVWEWTWDRYGTYPGATSDYMGPETDFYRVLRGGSWFDLASSARAADRNYNYPDDRFSIFGFRLTRTLP